MSPYDATVALLQEIAEFLHDQADVVDGDDGAPQPNKAMSLLTAVEQEIERLEGGCLTAVGSPRCAKRAPPA